MKTPNKNNQSPAIAWLGRATNRRALVVVVMNFDQSHGFTVEESQYRKNQNKKFDLLIGLFVALILSGLLFVEYGNINKIIFLILFLGGLIGLIQILIGAYS